MHHARAGRLADSERLLRQLLAQHPGALPARLALARVLQDQGKTGAALDTARACAAAYPQDVNAGGTLAQLLQAAGHLDEAIVTLRRIAALAPGHAGVRLHLVAVLQQAGRAREALTEIDALLALAPDAPDLWFNRALCLRDLGEDSRALEACGRVLGQRPEDAECWAIQAGLQHRAGLRDAARASAERALALAPEHPGALQTHGLVLLDAGEPALALPSLQKVCALQPGSAAAHSNLGMALHQSRQAEAALQAFDQALRCAPDWPELWFNRGVVLLDLRRMDEALSACERALALQPEHVDAQLNRALALLGLQREEAAIAACDALLQHGLPDRTRESAARFNRSMAAQALGRFEAARCDLLAVLALRPDHAEARRNLAQIDLLEGRFAEGWAGLEARLACKDSAAPRHTGLPRLQTLAALGGRRVRVWSEQGMGDTLQFCRYVPLLAARGAEVTLEVQAPLQPLLATLAGGRVIAVGEAAGEADCQIPLMSLPGLFGTTLDTIPADLPYLHVDPARKAVWQARIPPAADGRPHIGLAFSGNPAHGNDARRSSTLAACLPLTRIGHVHLLQTTLTAADRAVLEAHPEIRFHGEALHDFADTAAAASCMARIVSVDTSLAHLAGALGLPVELLLPQVPEWRWLTGRDDSPWYPGMRLWRQPAPGDWDTLLARLCQALSASAHP